MTVTTSGSSGSVASAATPSCPRSHETTPPSFVQVPAEVPPRVAVGAPTMTRPAGSSSPTKLAAPVEGPALPTTTE